MGSIPKIFLGLSIFFLPFQIHQIIYDGSAYSSGLFSVYTGYIIYISDIFLYISIISSIILSIKRKRYPRFGHYLITSFFITILIFSETSFFLAKDIYIVFFNILTLVKLYLLYLLIINKVLPIKTIIKILSISFSIQIFLGLYQLILQTPLGLHSFGEPFFDSKSVGIAKTNSLIRPYGTLPHPNILGGISFILFFLLGYIEKQRWTNILRIILLIGIFISYSLSAIIAFFISLFFYIFFIKYHTDCKTIIYKIILSILIILFIYLLIPQTIYTNQSFTERLLLIDISKNIITNNLFGVGSSNFVLNISSYCKTNLMPWEFQPVHNIYLLIASELGILCLAIIIYILTKIFILFFRSINTKHAKIVITIFIGIFLVIFNLDHYFWDIHIAQTIFIIYLSITSIELCQK